MNRKAFKLSKWLAAFALLTLSIPTIAEQSSACNLNNYSEDCRKLLLRKYENTYAEKFNWKTKNTDIFACNLINYSGQCREYIMLKSEATEKSAPLIDGCKSMGGTFIKAKCPVKDLVSQCGNNMYNEHDLNSVVYSNHYYRADIGNWTLEKTRRVCKNLGGTFSER